MGEGLFVGSDIYVRHLRLFPKFREADRHAGRSLRNLCLGYGTGTGRDLSLRRLHPSLDGFEAAMSNKFRARTRRSVGQPLPGLSLRVSSPPRPFKPCTTVVNSSRLGVVEKAPLTRGVGGFMARKDGGESEGIVLYPSRSPSLGWKPTPLAPLVRGVKAMRPTRGFSTAPSWSESTVSPRSAIFSRLRRN